MTSTWLPARRTEPSAFVTTVKCPRKGPLPSEISLLICGQMHDFTPERCDACGCRQAVVFSRQLEELRGTTRATLRVFREPTPLADVGGAVAEDAELDGGEVV